MDPGVTRSTLKSQLDQGSAVGPWAFPHLARLWTGPVREGATSAPEIPRPAVIDSYCGCCITNCSVAVAESNSWRARQRVCGWERRLALPGVGGGGGTRLPLACLLPQHLAGLEREGDRDTYGGVGGGVGGAGR